MESTKTATGNNDIASRENKEATREWRSQKSKESRSVEWVEDLVYIRRVLHEGVNLRP